MLSIACYLLNTFASIKPDLVRIHRTGTPDSSSGRRGGTSTPTRVPTFKPAQGLLSLLQNRSIPPINAPLPIRTRLVDLIELELPLHLDGTLPFVVAVVPDHSNLLFGGLVAVEIDVEASALLLATAADATADQYG